MCAALGGDDAVTPKDADKTEIKLPRSSSKDKDKVGALYVHNIHIVSASSFHNTQFLRPTLIIITGIKHSP